MKRDLPAGTVTFLFSDVEGSTRLLQRLGATQYAAALLEHRRAMRAAFDANGGVEIDTQGDAFFVAFPTAQGAVRAAAQISEALVRGPIRVRMGIHTGAPHLTEEGYVGEDVHKGARIAAAGHGGQVLISSATAGLIGTDGLRDLGAHRLKDLSAAERIWQLGDGEFPALKTLYKTNLPLAPTPFVGRERELATVVGLLSLEGVRVVTLTGPGGTGKTRLAMQAAAELAGRYPHGVWWVPLDALRQPDLVLETAGRAVGATGGLAEHVGDRKMLIAFDNFEHLIAAARDLAALIAVCPKIELLVTSREPLRIRGEHEYPVPPLEHAEGVRLFVDRVRALGRPIAPDATVSEIVRRLDDLPLAIELAAARTRVLSPAQILARLDRRLPLLTAGARDVPERQRTLRGAIEWSYELLTPAEQRLLVRLAVFRGGWTLGSAEAVAGAELDTLQSLVDKSLVRLAGERFSMLETIREFAAERLDASANADTVRELHTKHFFEVAAEHEPIVLRGADPQASLDHLDREHDNLRSILDRLVASGDTERAMLLAGMLFEFWCERDHGPEGSRRLEALLGADTRATRGRARALNAASHLASSVGDAAAGRRHAEEAVELNRAVGDPWDIAHAEGELASWMGQSGDFAAALPRYEAGVERFRALGDTNRELMSMRQVGWAHSSLGDITRYKEIHLEILRRARESGRKRIEFTALGALAWVATTEGRTADALALLREAYRLRAAVARSQVGLLFSRSALAHAVAGRSQLAAQLLGRSEAIREELGEVDQVWVSEQKQETRSTVGRDLDESAIQSAMEAGRAMTMDDAAALAFSVLED